MKLLRSLNAFFMCLAIRCLSGARRETQITECRHCTSRLARLIAIAIELLIAYRVSRESSAPKYPMLPATRTPSGEA